MNIQSFSRSVMTAALGFAAVSLCVFATVAFGERWMYTNLGLLGAYLAWTALFIVLGGAVLGTLVDGRWALPKFYILFAAAFFAYAIGWIGAYFILGGVVGEWVGSLLGAIFMALVLAAGFRAMSDMVKFVILLFVANSIGYFLGSALNNYVGGREGMLLWGAAYGLFLGAGIGAVLWVAQREGGKGKG